MTGGPQPGLAGGVVAWFKPPQKDDPPAEALRWVWRVNLLVLVLCAGITPRLWSFLHTWVAFVPAALLLLSLLLLPISIRSIEKRDAGDSDGR